ncbi:MAG: Hpt domain-containing protein, partial [Gemmatimonadetes bacterium]|nr:Hpt domain-containing protein [Gemmatimonadota bacterium]
MPTPSQPQAPLSDTFDFSALYDEYRDESQQQLSLLDAALLHLEETGELDDEERTTLLRALHTLKGNSGMMGLHAVVDAVHVMEAAFKSPGGAWPRKMVDSYFEAAAAMRRLAERVGTKDQESALERLAAVDLGPPPGVAQATDAILPPAAAAREQAGEPAGEAASGREPAGAASTGDREGRPERP